MTLLLKEVLRIYMKRKGESEKIFSLFMIKEFRKLCTVFPCPLCDYTIRNVCSLCVHIVSHCDRIITEYSQ
jgi:hypothetical protein